MPRFFVETINSAEKTAVIIGEDAHHIGRSLRMRVGEELTLCKDGVDYFSKITGFSESEVFCEIISAEPSRSEPSIELTLFQAMPKSDKLELIIQKAVELGAVKIVPVLTSRCVSRPDEKSFAKKLERLQRISLGASKQSGRGIIPVISGIISLDECARQMSALDTAFVCYEKGGSPLKAELLSDKKTVGVFIGSEGGFEESEIERLKSFGVVPIWLGERILRCETAPLAVISIIMNLSGNM